MRRALLALGLLVSACSVDSTDTIQTTPPSSGGGELYRSEVEPARAVETPEATPSAPGPKTRLILVTLDTTRADRLGSYGHAAAQTPTLDGLAERGARFTRALAPVPLTIPSHATLFTGLLPPHHGVRDNGDVRLSLEAYTLAERLQDAGYDTRAVVGAFVTQGHWGFGQGFDSYDDDLGVPVDRLSWRVERGADQVVSGGLRALSEGAEFVWLHLFDAHAPYEAPAPFNEQFSDPYDAEIAWVDHQLARLFSQTGPDDLIVVVGDHGEGLGEGHEREHGLLLGDATIRVPLILAGPGVPAGVFERPVSLADVAPSVLRLLGLSWDDAHDGVDLFEPSTRVGIYSETLYGHHHYGWSPLFRVTTDTGVLVRGSRDQEMGELSEEASTFLDTIAGWSPVWEEGAATLDLAQIEQLQALGYLGTSSDVPAVGGMDPAMALSSSIVCRVHWPTIQRIESATCGISWLNFQA